MDVSFDWDEANIAHIAEHDVEQVEAEEAVTYRPVFVQYLSRGGEDRFIQIGETLAGRILVVVVTPRKGLTRVVTAYPAKRAYREFYVLERDAQYGDREESPS
jgi:uncharacterized DUF497 family protein